MRSVYRPGLLIITVLLFSTYSYSQVLNAKVTTIDRHCRPGEAILSTGQARPSETVTISWSTGHEYTTHLYDLEKGDYWVKIQVFEKIDTLVVGHDTVINFNINEESCGVSVPKYFSPNSDGYNDFLNIGNIENYPDFEFQVFNKWGQKVHSQSKKYIPWDGTLVGIRLPDATYYYMFFYDSSDKNRVEKGDVTILR